MDRSRPGSPVYARQKSITSTTSSSSSATTPAPGSPISSPMHRHVRSGSAGLANFRRPQNIAARAAAQRLARVMADKPAEDDSDDDDLDAPPVGLSTPRRATRSPSPAAPAPSTLGRYPSDQVYSVRAPSIGRPLTMGKPTALIPPIKPLSRPLVTSLSAEPTISSSRREQRMSVDLGNISMRTSSHPRTSSCISDEIDVQQEENENSLEKLRLAEEKCEETDARVRQHEKQVASFRGGVSPEDRHVSSFSKESAFRQKEVASFRGGISPEDRHVSSFTKESTFRQKEVPPFYEGTSLEANQFNRKAVAPRRTESVRKVTPQNSDAKSEVIAALRFEAKMVRDDAASVTDHLQEAESEIKSLRIMAQKMLLSQEEMMEVVLKRCWLARYWSLCVQHGIHADIAESKHEYWSSFAPLPLEVVLSAGQKARDNTTDKTDVEVKDRDLPDLPDLSGEGNIESMLLVEKGLRELVSLKVEDAVLYAMSQHRRGNIKPGSMLSADGPTEQFELNQEESEDVRFKQAWLTHFWRRAKNHGLEEDIADERLQFWTEQSNHSPTSQDAVEVERGLFELKKLGIESQLWAVSRRGADQDSSNRGSQAESEH